ncbi:MAG: hypothetical protein JW888_04235, partial [Pirellulales bacterium]|nr:hypothetical protein [Pirellulales bacterium]
ADHDEVAGQILDRAVDELATMVKTAVEKLQLGSAAFPLALAGGVLLGSKRVEDGVLARLEAHGLRPTSVTCVRQPVTGAVILAQQLLKEDTP